VDETSLTPDPGIIRRRLEAHPLAVLATHGVEYPYTSLVSVALTPDALAFLFPTGKETRKFANLLQQERVSLLLDNRDHSGTESPYALTVLGVARELVTEAPDRAVLEAAFLHRHPHLAGFLADGRTALIRLEIQRMILVEHFSEVHELPWPPPVAGNHLPS